MTDQLSLLAVSVVTEISSVELSDAQVPLRERFRGVQ